MTPTGSRLRSGWIGMIWANPFVRILLFGSIYLIAVKIGLGSIVQPEGISMVWPVSGVVLAILLLRPPREWWIILATFFSISTALHLAVGDPIFVSIGMAFFNTVGPTMAAYVMKFLRRNLITFERLGDMAALVFVATVINAVITSLGVFVPVISFNVSYTDVWGIWWISDGLGILVVTPFLVLWARSRPFWVKRSLGEMLELIVWFVVLGLSAWFMFGVSNINTRLEPRPYMLFPVLVWGALRFNPRSLATGLILITMIALSSTAAGIGMFPLGGHTFLDRMLAVQAFFWVGNITTMLLNISYMERTYAEEEIKRSEKRFRALVENGGDAVTLVGVDGKVIYEGPTVERITGYPAKDRIGMSGFETLYPDDLPAVRKTFASVLATPGISKTMEFRAVRKDGRIWWAEGTATNLLNDPSVGGIVINYRDITTRKYAEAELVESRKRIQDVVNAAPYGAHTYELLPDGRLVFTGANRSADLILGVDNQQFVSKTIEDAFPHLVGTEIPQAYRRVAASGEPYYQEQVTYQGQGISGTFEVHGIQTSPNVITVFFRDVTERNQAEKEREHLLGELERKNRELETLVYIASHDLRSPLVNIQGFGKNLQKYFSQISDILESANSLDEYRSSVRTILAERIPTALHFIATGSTKIESLIDGLLRLSRIERASLHPEMLIMTTLVQGILDAMAFQLETGSATINIAQPLADCYADRNQLGQVFSNLLDNAVKYRAADRPLVITISSRVDLDKVIYTIADTGVGIAPEEQSKIWQIFHRVEYREGIPGEGLGLTIAQRIVERHNGRIWVESESGVGSRFHVELPAKNDFQAVSPGGKI